MNRLEDTGLTHEYAFGWAEPDPRYHDAFELWPVIRLADGDLAQVVNGMPVRYFRRPVWRGLWVPMSDAENARSQRRR